jgi:hypothetical protein
MRIVLKSRGDWRRTRQFLKKLSEEDYLKVLDSAAQMGVEALASATPKDSGLTASSWEYRIIRDGSGTTIEWGNTNQASGWFNVALALQYGHGTGTGGYVKGYDYINPAIKPVFDNIAKIVWEAVISS